MALQQWLKEHYGDAPVFMTGIKGQGMSALARLLAESGVLVVGSDTPESFVTDFRLQHPNVKVLAGFAADQVPGDTRTLIYSAGYPQSHVEITAARARGLATHSYPEFMGQLTQVVPTVCVAGTHGKTTTVGLIGHILAQLGLEPTVISGGGRAAVGDGSLLVLESCEFRRHFLNYRPVYNVITNIEYDHPDYYADLAAVEQAFAEFAAATAPEGVLVLTDNCPQSARLEAPPGRRQVRCGLATGSAVRARVLRTDPCAFEVYYQDQLVGLAETRLWGMHNVYNALQGLAVTRDMGLEPMAAIRALNSFPGVPRRLQYVGTIGEARIMDDFAHHPSEIQSSLRALRQMNPSRLVVVFQPHTFSRTKALLAEFGRELGAADEVALIPIYGSVREPTGDVCSEDLVEHLPPDKVRIVPIDGLVEYINQLAAPGVMVVFMGAGDIGTITQQVMAAAGAGAAPDEDCP